MKKVAGTLRLDLAQYREMAAFAQFASDLDAATRAQLERGARLTELLKQGQYVPLPVEKQVVIVYAGTNGYIDKLPVDSLREYEEELYRYIDEKHPELWKEIREKGELTDEIKKQARQGAQEVHRSAFGGERRRSDGLTRPSDAQPENHPQAHLERQEHAEDHARHEDGRRRAPEPRAAAHPRAAPVRREDRRGAGRGDGSSSERRLGAGSKRSIRCSRAARRQSTLFLVITSDRGLCGAFNTNILRARRAALARARGAGPKGADSR